MGKVHMEFFGSRCLSNGAEDMLAGELPKQLQNVVRSRQSTQESHRIHSGKTIVD